MRVCSMASVVLSFFVARTSTAPSCLSSNQSSVQPFHALFSYSVKSSSINGRSLRVVATGIVFPPPLRIQLSENQYRITSILDDGGPSPASEKRRRHSCSWPNLRRRERQDVNLLPLVGSKSDFP